MDFRAATLEMHFVHQATDEVNAAAMSLVQVLALGGVGKQPGIESRPRVADHDEHAVVVFKHNGALHELCGITKAAMFDGVGEGLA